MSLEKEMGEMKPYRELKEIINGKKGKQILVVKENIESYHRGGCFGNHSYTNVESTLRLGVLTSDIIFEFGNGESDIVSSYSNDYTNLQGPRIIVPAEKHVKRNHGLEWQLIEGHIEIPFFEIYNLDVNGERTTSEGIISSLQSVNYRNRLLINIGSKEVLNYFKSKMSLYKDDFSYVGAARFLGIEDELPEEFVIGYNEEVRGAKEDVIKRLRELADKEVRLKDATDYSKFRGDKELVDEVAFVLNAPFEKLRETTRNIKSNLERAVKLRMHQEKSTIPGDRPGETLNVPEYITIMCENYEVNV